MKKIRSKQTATNRTPENSKVCDGSPKMLFSVVGVEVTAGATVAVGVEVAVDVVGEAAEVAAGVGDVDAAIWLSIHCSIAVMLESDGLLTAALPMVPLAEYVPLMF
jgi:hypothetical protein